MEPIEYMTSLLTFYLKGEIKSEQNFINFKVPNTILGLIPLGARTSKLPVNQIASVSTIHKQATSVWKTDCRCFCNLGWIGNVWFFFYCGTDFDIYRCECSYRCI